MDAHLVRLRQLTALLLFILLALVSCGKANRTVSVSQFDFTLLDLQGKRISYSDFQGQVLMVNFWAPWCGPCRRETPDLIELYDGYKSQGLQILGVAVAFRGEQSVRDFAAQFGVTYPILFGNENLVKAYGGFRGIPTTFLFSRDGELYRKYEGMRSRSVFENDIRELL
jgi:thiol-disulfide isomerase/thioredoxin